MVLDMAALEESDLILLHFEPLFDVPYWNDVMDLGPEAWATLRARLKDLIEIHKIELPAVALARLENLTAAVG